MQNCRRRGAQSALAGVLMSCLVVFTSCGPASETQQILTRLKSSNPSVRLKAISDAEKQADRGLRDALLRVFEDQAEVPIVRGAAGLALGRLHDERLPGSVLKQVPQAVANARGTNRMHQIDAFLLGKALVAYGPEGMPALGKLLNDSRKEVAMWAVSQHGLYMRNDRAFEVLSSFLENRDPAMRRAAVYGLAQSFHPGAEAKLVKLAADSDPEVRYHAAWGLANFGSVHCTPAVERQLSKELEPQVKQELATALANIRSRTVTPPPPALAPGKR